mmetsp:Transcript_341/g.807  ORF Transcript_341/g.807 Transcript_341/m.807 type:complete len:191 (+) Transcript_341:2746-3318(+)
MPANGIEPLMSVEFPENAQELIQKVNLVMIQLTGVGLTGIVLDPNTAQPLLNTPAQTSTHMSSVGNAQLNAALGYAASVSAAGTQQLSQDLATTVGGIPSKKILIRNMFDKDQESEEGWWIELKEEVQEECSKHGIVKSVTVQHELTGGMVNVTFQNLDGAAACAKALAGRWFDQRQLLVKYIAEDEVAL